MKFDNPSRKFNEYFAINHLHNSENTVPNLTDMTDGRTECEDRKNSKRICKKYCSKVKMLCIFQVKTTCYDQG